MFINNLLFSLGEDLFMKTANNPDSLFRIKTNF